MVGTRAAVVLFGLMCTLGLVHVARDVSAADFSDEAAALPYPPDASGLEFTAWAGDIEFRSDSPLKSLAEFYLKQMAARGWELDESDVDIDDDAIELNFKHGDASVEVRFSQSSKEVRVRIDSKGLKFTGVDDPAKLAAAGIPAPRAALFVQQEIPLPENVQNLQYGAEGCMLKSSLKLEEAFAFFTGKIKAKGFRESRRPIVTDTRRYTEFASGTVKLSVNVFSDDVGSRIILTHEDARKPAAVAPLPAVASLSLKLPGNPDAPATGDAPAATRTPIDVAKNKGSITVTFGDEKLSFPHVACFQTKDRGSYATMAAFSSKPIPLNKLQSLVASEDDVAFFDLYEQGTPNYLVLQLGKYLSFSFSSPGVGVANSIEESVNEMKIEGGRVRGTFKMLPKEILSRQFSFTATIDAALITPQTRISGPADPIETSSNPIADDWPFPLPAGAEDVSREGSRFRKTHRAMVGMPLAEVAAFYREQLPAKGWKPVDGGTSDSGSPEGDLKFTNDTLELSASFTREGDQTSIEIVTRDAALARKEGVLPEPGKGRLIMANASDVDVVYTIGKTDYKLAAGRGAKDFKQALNYSIPAATYKVLVKIPGEPERMEAVEVTEGSSWAIVALPSGGYLPIRLY